MNKILVIVESPKKARTIAGFLGEDFIVKATVGHLFDLPKRENAFDPVSYDPYWEILRGKNKILDEIIYLSKKAQEVWVATDPDREGEAIAAHLWEKIAKQNSKLYRIRFLEITKDSIQNAIQNKTKLNKGLVEAQIARRILDRIAGYGMSPLLWKIREGASAGRVQSVPLKWIVLREKEISEFISKEYFQLEADFLHKQQIFLSKHIAEDDKLTENEASDILLKLVGTQTPNEINENSSIFYLQNQNNYFIVSSIEEKKNSRKPPPPYTTSELQKDASSKLGISPSGTMKILNQLYEGKNTPKGTKGLITYPRTDSVRISPEATKKGMAYWKDRGVKAKMPFYKNKKNSKIQDAHEAIRPSDIFLTPDIMKNYLSSQELLVYELIWKRFAACFLESSITQEIKIQFQKEKIFFETIIQALAQAGYLEVYGKKNEKEIKLSIKLGDKALLSRLQLNKKFTTPPERFTEASLIAKMEKTGIGRPSTYATTIELLFKREYATKLKKSVLPTELGVKVYYELERKFSEILEDKYTSQMEDSLDQIETGELDRIRFLKEFENFFQSLKERKISVKKNSLLDKKNCPTCKEGRLVIKNSKKKKPYQICSRFPDCDYMEYL